MLDRKAIVYGVLIYIGLYVAHLLIIPLVAKVTEDTGTFSFLWILNQLLGFATVGVSGFVAGHIARRRRFSHGFSVGALGTVISALAALLVSLFAALEPPSIDSVFGWLITNGFLSGLAAMFSENFDRGKSSTKDHRAF